MDSPQAACCLLVRDDHRILGISRGLNVFDIGIPGGHVEGDPTLAHAAARELLEETGVVTNPDDLVLRFVAPGRTLTCATFVPTRVAKWPRRLSSKPFEGFVAWLPREAFLQPTCSFRQYHAALFRHLEI